MGRNAATLRHSSGCSRRVALREVLAHTLSLECLLVLPWQPNTLPLCHPPSIPVSSVTNTSVTGLLTSLPSCPGTQSLEGEDQDLFPWLIPGSETAWRVQGADWPFQSDLGVDTTDNMEATECRETLPFCNCIDTRAAEWSENTTRLESGDETCALYQLDQNPVGSEGSSGRSPTSMNANKLVSQGALKVHRPCATVMPSPRQALTLCQ